MEYPLTDVVKKRLRMVDKSWIWLAEQCGVSRNTLNNQLMVLERLSLEQLRFISSKIEFNLLEDYVSFLKTTKDDRRDLFQLDEPKAEYKAEQMPIWLCLKGTVENYQTNFANILSEMSLIAEKGGFKLSGE